MRSPSSGVVNRALNSGTVLQRECEVPRPPTKLRRSAPASGLGGAARTETAEPRQVVSGRGPAPRPAVELGLIERGVGGPQQVGRLSPVLPRHRDADAHADACRCAGAEVVRRSDRLDQPTPEARGLFRRAPCGEHDELVAAEARRDVALPQQATHALGHAFQQPIARGVTVRVVDRLEVVQVEIEQRQRLVRAPGSRQPLDGREGCRALLTDVNLGDGISGWELARRSGRSCLASPWST